MADDRFSEDAFVVLLKDVAQREASDPRLAKVIAQTLVTTASHAIRDAAALALVDLDARDEADALVQVMRRPELAGRCGTLVFALDELGVPMPLDLLVHLIKAGSYEAKAEALLIAEAGRIASCGDPERDKALIGDLAALANDSDGEVAEAARLASASLAA